LLALWDWLARPSVATGFAGVMVATLVALMWWDQPMDEAMPRRPAPAVAPAAAPAAPPSLAEAPASVVAAAPTAPPAEAPRRAAEAPRPALRKSAPAADKQADQAVAPRAATTPTPAPVTTPAAPPSPAPAAPAMADTAPATTEAAAGALAQAKSAEEFKRQRSAAFSDAPGRMAKAEANESAARQAAAARISLAPVRAAIAAEPARWAWQRGSGPVQDMNDTVYAWLSLLDGAAGTAWQPTGSENTSASPSGDLRLLRDGQWVHTLRLAEHGVIWKRGQSAWSAELPATTLQTLASTAP
jgi:hypothetical protein